MLEHVHNQQGIAPRGMSGIMLIDPEIDKFVGARVLVQNCPADAAHGAGGSEILFPGLYAPETCRDCLGGFTVLVDTAFAAQVFEVIFMKPHAIEFPAKPSFQFGKLG